MLHVRHCPTWPSLVAGVYCIMSVQATSKIRRLRSLQIETNTSDRILTVSQMFILQQFSIVISHCSGGCGGRLVRGVTFLLTMILFLILGLFLSTNTFLRSNVVAIVSTIHTAPSSIDTQSLNDLLNAHDCFSSALVIYVLFSVDKTSYCPLSPVSGHL